MYFRHYEFPKTNLPMEFDDITKIEGPLKRHIEQLWDEVKKLKERVKELEKENGMDQR